MHGCDHKIYYVKMQVLSFKGAIHCIQLISTGVLGEYIGKIYLETKQRPRYIISERTESVQEQKSHTDQKERTYK